MPEDVVIVGAGQAGAQAAAALRSQGFDGAITLVGEEAHLPYQRPPLSKALLLGKQEAEAAIWRPAAFYQENRIALRLGVRATELDRDGQRIRLGDGTRLAYDHLILATGTRPRLLAVPGADLPGVLTLRTLADAAKLRQALAGARHLVVIGGGFIGLEVAASARGLGCDVTLIEAQMRLMARSVAHATSARFAALHEAEGVRLQLGIGVQAIQAGPANVGLTIVTPAGRIECDLVLVGIGALANDELAAAAGLATANGILVDARGRTEDPTVYAIGDCAVVTDPESGRGLRLESVQNAVDQGRAIAAHILGRPPGPPPVPWFWSDQYDVKLQIAGVADASTETEILRGHPDESSFSVFRYSGERLTAVDSINAAAEHMIARRLLAAGLSPDPTNVRDRTFDLRQLLVQPDVSRP